MKVVIVGGVAGGASAAARLRRLNEDAEIIMLEKGSYISYANCGLPYYIGGEITDREDLAVQTPQGFNARFRVDIRLRQEAVKIDTLQKVLTIKNHDTGEEYQESYDSLVLSPGAEPIRPNLPGIDDSRVFTLRTIPNTFAIHEFIQKNKPQNAVVVGGGFIGLEMAESLSHAGLKVSIVEMASHLMPPMDFEMAQAVHRHLKAKGVQLYLSQPVKGFGEQEGRFGVQIENGWIPADMVIMAIGVKPDTGFVKESGIAVNDRGGIITDNQMRTSAKHVYAVGDAVEITNFVSGQKGMVPMAGPANRQGRIAADNIAGIKSVYKDTQGSAIVRVFGQVAAVTGLNETAAAAAGLAYDMVYLTSASHATYYPGATSMTVKLLFEKTTGKVLGAQIVGFDGVDKRCDVVAAAIRAGMTVSELTELELCYAPPFSSAKDPVNMAGYAAENVVNGLVKQYHWKNLADLPRDGSVQFLDVRTDGEFSRGHVEGFAHIPLDDLRRRIGELDQSKPVYVNCQSGLRSYLACRILCQQGFDCYNIAGGYNLYSLWQEK